MKKERLTICLTGKTKELFLAIKEKLGKEIKTRDLVRLFMEERIELFKLREENETLKGALKKFIKNEKI